MKILILLLTTLITLFQFITPRRHHNINLLGNSTNKQYKNITCDYTNCPEERGICNIDNECYCFQGYITTEEGENNNTYCNYEQKSQMIAFLLEFILSFGLGHLYIKNYIIGG